MCGAPTRRTPLDHRCERRRGARLRPTGPPVLGPAPTRTWNKRLRPRIWGRKHRIRRGLTRLFVHRVALVPAAVLLHLDAFAVVDLRFHRDVVAALAVLAGESDLHAFVVLGHLLVSYLMILTTRP